jgi:hypothetical protein
MMIGLSASTVRDEKGISEFEDSVFALIQGRPRITVTNYDSFP